MRWTSWLIQRYWTVVVRQRHAATCSAQVGAESTTRYVPNRRIPFLVAKANLKFAMKKLFGFGAGIGPARSEVDLLFTYKGLASRLTRLPFFCKISHQSMYLSLV